MRNLMSQLLFDRPFDPKDATNRINPALLHTIDTIRFDAQVVEKVAMTKRAFLGQNDCVCHGDLGPDNILLKETDFRVSIMSHIVSNHACTQTPPTLTHVFQDVVDKIRSPGPPSKFWCALILRKVHFNGYIVSCGHQIT